MRGLTFQIRADRLEVHFAGLKKRHRERNSTWNKLFRARNGALKADVRAERKAKQLALPFGGRQ